jgi:predicted glycosyl hydrolase (DUF1957 family)
LIFLKKFFLSWAWWYIPVIPALGRLRQEDHQFEVNLGFTVRPCLKNKQTNKPGTGGSWTVILATQEAEIRLKASSANSSRDPSLKIPNTKKGW